MAMVAILTRGLAYLRTYGFRRTLSKTKEWRDRRVGYRRYQEFVRSIPAVSLDETSRRPLISVVIPVYNPPHRFLRECLESVINQVYPEWEMCIADDASSDPLVIEMLREYKSRYPERIKTIFREKNGHISEATNTALSLAEGDFVAFLDHDDVLTPDALLAVAALINRRPDADMIYSDEDKIDKHGRLSEPFFKPEWSPETILGQMYTCHLGVYRRDLLLSMGGFRKGFEGAQDHDLVLRLSEQTNRIYHIPKVLYHWRTTSKSTAANPHSKMYAFEAGQKAVKSALARRGIDGWTESLPDIPGVCLVHYRPKAKPLVSIIILTRDNAPILHQCLLSVFTRTEYDHYEIILVDNGSREEETFAVFDKWKKIFIDRLRILSIDVPFNFSYLNNKAAEVATGDILLLLNNDTEVWTAGWMGEMAGWAQRDEIGAVGACLVYPDKRIQHAGVVLGITGNPAMRGVAGHSHKGLPEDSLGYFSRLKFVSNYAAVTGACLMVRKSVYSQVGGLDESLAYAFNDVDFCLKLLKKGLRNVVLPQAKLIHHESRSRGYEDSPEKQKRFAGEIETMLQRWDELLERDPYYSPHLTLWREDFSLKSKEEYKRCGGNQLS